MKITPLEIRQKNFEVNFRGYNKDEVNAFLLTLSQEWERLMDEAKELRLKLESSEKEVAKLREVESSLFKTLKTAEDTGSHLIEQSRQSAELLLRETQLKADALLNEAKTKAKDLTDEAELHARQRMAEMEMRLKALSENYKKLESTRDDMLHELKRIAQDTMERAERIRSNNKDFDVDFHITQAAKEFQKIVQPNKYTDNAPPKAEDAPPPIRKVVTPEPVPELVMEQPMAVEAKGTKKITSFFDEIE
ncbi:MAG: DivIVA domain-containing protein [Cyclobacteriaceae bacterium]